MRGDSGIGAAPRLAAAHRAADTNAPGGHLNHTPGEGACVSHVAACAVLVPPAPSKAPHYLRVPAVLIGLQRGRTGQLHQGSRKPPHIDPRRDGPRIIWCIWRRVGAPAHFTSSASFRALFRRGLQGARTAHQAQVRPMPASLRPKASSGLSQ